MILFKGKQREVSSGNESRLIKVTAKIGVRK
jgi:hypothetical protein